MSYKQPNMSEADFIKKGNMIGNLDELIENMTNARSVPNRKPNTKPNIDHYISGRVAVDLGDGKIYYPRIDIEINKSGRTIGYNIADIKEFPTYHSDDQPRAREMGTHGRNYSVSQNGQNINTKLEFEKVQNSLTTRKSKRMVVTYHGKIFRVIIISLYW